MSEELPVITPIIERADSPSSSSPSAESTPPGATPVDGAVPGQAARRRRRRGGRGRTRGRAGDGPRGEGTIEANDQLNGDRPAIRAGRSGGAQEREAAAAGAGGDRADRADPADGPDRAGRTPAPGTRTRSRSRGSGTRSSGGTKASIDAVGAVGADQASATAPTEPDEPNAGQAARPSAPARRRRASRPPTPAGVTPIDDQAAPPTGDGPADEAPPAPRRTRAPRRPSGVSAEGTVAQEGPTSAGPEADVPPDADPADGTPAQPGTGRRRRRRRRRGSGAGSGEDGSAATETTAQDAVSDVAAAPSPRTNGTRTRARPAASAATTGATRRRSPAKPKPAGAETSEAPGRAARDDDGAEATPPPRRRRTRAGTVSAAEPDGGAPQEGPGDDDDDQGSTRTRRRRLPGRRRREPVALAPRVANKIMLITENEDRDQIAVVQDRVLVEHYITRSGATSMVGNIYMARVQNVLPGMEAAFVDIGRGRNAVLYAGEVAFDEDEDGPRPRIEKVLKSGQTIMVQVTKDPIGGKGARVTQEISLPGRYVVFVPKSDVFGISRRLPDTERQRLKRILKDVKPEGDGLIVRTAAEGASEEDLRADLERLTEEWALIQKASKKGKAPKAIYEEPELTVRVVRDLYNEGEFKEMLIESAGVYDRITSYLRSIAPELLPHVKRHEGKLSLFESYHVIEQIHKALDRKAWLPSGGYLVIDKTEAMTVIDVNTGKHVGKANLEETVTKTNVEAAEEVARQLRLRDIGGIIIIDFIDMLLEKNRKLVRDTLANALAQDKTKSQVFDIGPLGLLEVTRKRVSSGLLEAFSHTCPTCEGRGIIVTHKI